MRHCENSLDIGQIICTRCREIILAKKSYYVAANAIFGKIGRYASEDVTFQLINVKCVPILMYGLEACPLVKSDLSSLDFVIG